MSETKAPKQDDILESFPNLQGLKAFAPPEEWARTPLPRLPPEVNTGVLDNGLTYFIQENREPKARAELYLVVGFGSLVEEEEERGIAHIIEHLGFSATKSYENHAIVKFLESIGAPFGACQNAYTSFDRTVYTLHVPTDKEGLVKESLSVLREFAFFTRISQDDLEKERKVVFEEWRESKNAQGRLFEKYINALCNGCKWCERLPIGTEEVIMGVGAETLRKFYQKFYHPARMAVIAVGDFDASTMAKDIEKLFGIAPDAIEPLPRAPTAPDRPTHAVPDSDGVVVASSTDPELSFAQGIVDCKRPRMMPKSLADFRRRVAEDVFHRALSSRLLKLTVEPRGARNFFMVGTETGEPVPVLNPMTIQIAPLPGRMRQALEEIVTEIERVKRLGFHDAEVSRAKRSMLAEFEESYIERAQRPSETFAEEYVSLFLDDTPAPGVEKTSQIAATVLPSISCEEVSRVADQFVFEKNVVAKLATPSLSVMNPLYSCWNFYQALKSFRLPRQSLDLPKDTEVEAIIRSVQSKPLDPWPEDQDNPETRLRVAFDSAAQKHKDLLPASAPGSDSPHRSVRRIQAQGVPRPTRADGEKGVDLQKPISEAPELGEEVVLRNGLRIFLKATDLFDDEILLRGRRWGGLTEHQGGGVLSSKGVVSCEAQVCSTAAMMLGICGLSVESLQESLDGKRVEPNPPNLETYSTGLDGSSSPVDFESLLTLINLLFLCPVKPEANSRGRLSLVKLGLLACRLGENRDPQAQFGKRVMKCITNDHPYTRPMSLWNILRMNFAEASSIFNERASRPNEWSFALVGKLPPREVLLPLLDKYLGSIPNFDADRQPVASERKGELEAREAVTPLSVEFPSKQVKEEVHLHMVDPKGSTVLCFPIELASVTEVGSKESAVAELKDLFMVRLLVRLLQTRLIEVLRFQRGQVYGVQVGEDFSLAPPQLGRRRKGTLSVSFECDPAEADELVDATKAELQRLRSGEAAFTEDNVNATREQERREFEECFRKNDWWAATIIDLYFSRCHVVTDDIGTTMELWWRARSEVVESLDVARAQQILKSLLPADDDANAASAVITMRPRGRRWWWPFGQAPPSTSSPTKKAAVPDSDSR